MKNIFLDKNYESKNFTIDYLIELNSHGQITDKQRWDLKKYIESAYVINYPCLLCEKQTPLPSKRIENSQYCREHLLYSLALGKNIKEIH